MTAYLRATLRTAGLTAMGAGAAYTSHHYYNTTFFSFNTAHAEAPQENSKIVKKVFPGKGFTELKLKSAEMVNHNVRKLTFALPDDESVTGIDPVTSLLTQHTPEGAFIPVFRPYTPISANDEPGSVSFLIKRYPNGKASGKMHSLQPGESMRFRPIPEFTYKTNDYSHMTFVAGGSGITPIYQLTRAILRNPDDHTRITLLYANNSEQDILLKSEFEDLERQYPGRFQKLFVVSKPEADGSFEKGYVTKEILKKVMPNKSTERNVKVLVSGPPPMTAAIAGAKGGFGWTQGSLGGILSELGYKKDEVYKF